MAENKIIIKDICCGDSIFIIARAREKVGGVVGGVRLSGKCSGNNSVIKDDMADVRSTVSGAGTERLSSQR